MIIYVIVSHWIWIRGFEVGPSMNQVPILVYCSIWSFW